jgi:hypothetical protein
VPTEEVPLPRERMMTALGCFGIVALLAASVLAAFSLAVLAFEILN